MNKNSNAYIITYSTVMVVIVALLLGFASNSLKDRQNANIENEMKEAILISIGKGADAAKADDRFAYISQEYDKYINDSYLVNTAGEVVEGDAFTVLNDLKAEYDKPVTERLLPVFVSRGDSGTNIYVLPVRGKGLWGPIWGYVALESDWSTIFGVVFDHQGETPGLGAEIATPNFYNQFKGKNIFREAEMVSIAVLKGSGSSAGNNYAVDAISGGTITSKAVEDMLRDCLGDYGAYIMKQRSGAGNERAVMAEPGTVEADINTENADDNE